MKIKLPTFENAKVMTVGDVMLDRYWYGQTNRISPESPVPVVKLDIVTECPGGAANVAMNVAALGATSHLVGLIGVDDAALTLREALVGVNVKCDFISLPTHPTITKLRVISQNQQLIRIDFEKKFSNTDSNLLHKFVSQAKEKNIGVLVLSDYAKGTLNNVQKIIQFARKINIPVLVDPKGKNFERYRGATLLKPNFSEFEAVVGKCDNEKEIIEGGMKLINNFQFSSLLITRSKKGMILLQVNKKPIHISTQAQEVYDVTGAGDTVIGVIAAALAAGSILEEACYLANIAASVVVGKTGTSTISSIELRNAVRSNLDTNFGIMTEAELKAAVIDAHNRNEKVVMTNGVFDILHAGHIAYLSNARKLGDRLIVAVNSDASTRRLKGKKRPVNPLEQRMIMLGSLKFVDWVISFEEDTPQRLISTILPDFLVKGGDYKIEQIAGNEMILINGGEVMTLDFSKGYSTTNIINKILINYQ